MYKCLLAYFYDGYYLIDEDTREEYGPFEIIHSDGEWLTVQEITEVSKWTIRLCNKYVYQDDFCLRLEGKE